MIASELGITVAQIEEEMTPEEFLLWGSFFEYRNEEQKKALDKK